MGNPQGQAGANLTFPENAAKEAFEEAGVIGYISPSSVGMFRAKKRTANPLIQQTIEVWVYLLEVTETAPDWPERDKRAIRWMTCEAAARHLASRYWRISVIVSRRVERGHPMSIPYPISG